MTFPGLLIFSPHKTPLEPPLGGVGQICLGSYDSQINTHVRAKFGRGSKVVSKNRGGTDCQADKRTLQLYIVDKIYSVYM